MKTITMILLALFCCCNLQSEKINWSDPVLLSTQGQDATDQHIAIDLNGNIGAVWIENGFVMFCQQLTGGAWSLPAVAISSFGASEPRIAFDANGMITVLWLSNGVVSTVSKSLTGNWNSVTPLSASGAAEPQLAVDSSGNCVAIWNRQGSIESSTKLSAGSWSASPDVLASTAGSAPQVYISSNGATVAVWHGLSSGHYAVFSSSKNIGGSWSLPAQIISTSNDNQYPQVAVDASGNALAIWYNCTISGTTYTNISLQFASCPYQGSWTTPGTITNTNVSDPSAGDAKIAFDTKGDAIVLWKTQYVGDFYGIRTIVRNPNGSWEPPIDLVALNLYAYAADMSVTSRGEAFVAFMFYDTSSSLLNILVTEAHIAAYENSFWAVPINLSTGNINGYPKIAASLTGNTINAASLWQNYGGINKKLYATTGSGTVILPPTNPTVTQSSNNFGLFTEYNNTVSWGPSPSPSASAYIVFRNGEFFTRVPATFSQIIDYNTGLNEPVTYAIATLDDQDAQSENVTVSFPSPGILRTFLDGIGSFFAR